MDVVDPPEQPEVSLRATAKREIKADGRIKNLANPDVVLGLENGPVYGKTPIAYDGARFVRDTLLTVNYVFVYPKIPFTVKRIWRASFLYRIRRLRV